MVAHSPLEPHMREKSLIFTPKSPGDHAEVLRQPSAAPRQINSSVDGRRGSRVGRPA